MKSQIYKENQKRNEAVVKQNKTKIVKFEIKIIAKHEKVVCKKIKKKNKLKKFHLRDL